MNIPLTRDEVKKLPKGLTETPFFSKKSKWDNRPSKFIPRNKDEAIYRKKIKPTDNAES